MYTSLPRNLQHLSMTSTESPQFKKKKQDISTPISSPQFKKKSQNISSGTKRNLQLSLGKTSSGKLNLLSKSKLVSQKKIQPASKRTSSKLTSEIMSQQASTKKLANKAPGSENYPRPSLQLFCNSSSTTECKSPDKKPQQSKAYNKYWIKEFGLTMIDKSQLCNGEWLTDKHITVVIKLLATQFPDQDGLQDTLLLSKYLSYQSGVKGFVQIINISNQHWVCVSNILSSPGVIEVYDSLPQYTFNSSSLRQQVAAIIKRVWN